MSQAVQYKNPQVANETIVDTDFHIQVPIDYLYKYIDDKQILRKLEEFGPPKKPRGEIKGNYASEDPSEGETSGVTTHGQAISSEDIVKVKEEMGLDHVIATPPPNSPVASGRYPAILKELIRAYNDFLLEEIIDLDEEIYGSVLTPRWDPEAAVEELDRVGSEKGVIGIADFLSLEPPLGHAKYEPLLEKAESLGHPFIFHVAGEYLGRREPLSEHFETKAETILTGGAFMALNYVMNPILTGVFDKYPDLDIVIQEIGTGWIPYAAYQLDEYYQVYGKDLDLIERLREMNQETIKQMPSDYFFENFHVTTQPIGLPQNKRRAEALFEVCNAKEMFMFSSDWPHGTIDSPDWVFDQNFIDDDLRTDILSGNAKNVFDI